MRRRERDEAAELARRRLAALHAEMHELRSGRDGPPPAEGGEPPDDLLDMPSLPGLPGPAPVPAGLPADLGPFGAVRDVEEVREDITGWREVPDRPVAPVAPVEPVVRTSVGRPLAPEPARVPPPGRHAVHHRSRSEEDGLGSWATERLPAPLRDRVSLTGHHLLVLVLVLGVGLVAAAWWTLRGGSSQDAVPQARLVSGGASTSASSDGTAAAAGATATSSAAAGARVVVDVAGKVRRPGLVTLPAGSRVNDAITRAGGLTTGARTAGLNLARVLVDGEQLVVGAPQPAAATGASPASGAPVGAAGSAPTGAMVNINTGGLTELDELPGVGPVTAQKILDYRTAHGAFTSLDQLLDVDGIGDKTLADIKPRATL